MRNLEQCLDAAKLALNLLLEAGAEKAECVLRCSRLHEITAEASRFNLMRTITTEKLSMRAICDGRTGKVEVNLLDKQTLSNAAKKCIQATQFAIKDPYADVAEFTQNERFSRGALEGDVQTLAFRLVELSEDLKREYPIIMFELSGRHTHEYEIYLNSNGVELADERGVYLINTGFTAVRDKQTTSFGPGTRHLLLDPDVRYITLDEMREEAQRAINLLDPAPVGNKFVGTMLATPTFTNQFFFYLSRIALSDASVTSGKSRLIKQLGKQVADKRLNWEYRPYGPEIVMGERITPDGYCAKDFVVIENGVLRGHLLTRQGAARSGLSRAANSGSGICVRRGAQTFSNIIAGIDRGVIIGRYSGTEPGEDGEISGVVKNGFLIENGQIAHPIVEAMVSANIFDMLTNMRAVSAEARCNGASVLPWIAFDGVTVK